MNNPAPRVFTSRRLRWAVTSGALVMVLMGLLLLYLLMQATNNRDLYERNYSTLVSVNIAVASMLLTSIAWVGYSLWIRLRRGKFGSRLLVKLAVIFALVGCAPGVLIYVVSFQFVSRSIETWFDVKVEGALEGGLSLGRATLDTLTQDLVAKSRVVAGQLGEQTGMITPLAANRLLDQLGALEVSVWGVSGKLLASAGQSAYQLSPTRPTPTQLRLAKAEQYYAWVEGLDEEGVRSGEVARVRALVPVPTAALGLTLDERYLLVTRTLPSHLVASALAVEAAYREYQERALARGGLKRMYIGTLTLSLFLAVFGAVLLAVILGNQIARPLLVLAEGVSQVAAGDLRPKATMQGRDELDGLTRAFALMNAQLADARQALERSVADVDAARDHLQKILDNLTAGVMVLGEQGEIRSFNPGAERILGHDLRQVAGSRLSAVPGLEQFGSAVQQQCEVFDVERGDSGHDHWQHTLELGVGGAVTGAAADGPHARARTLVVRGTWLSGDQRLLVFDDISEIVSAQRTRAWGEVARRLAHEIKNPLTPIQLSAERLQIKLAGKLPAPEEAVLAKSVKTIVDQVDAMKRLVNEFRDYARLPSANLKPLDLNALVQDVAGLYESEGSKARLQLDLESGLPPVRGDAQQLRQILHNLLLNAQDAIESANRTDPQDCRVIVRTQAQRSKGRVRLVVLDHGTGFSEHILQHAFEPYVTTKPKGTGLGLAVVKKVADEHGARIDITNRVQDGVVMGAQVSLSLAMAPPSST